MKIRYLRLSHGDHLPPADKFEPYKAVVIVEDRVEPDWQRVVSQWLAETGCLYMIAWGKDCGSWDDSVDMANLRQFEFGEIPNEHFIMTTWHEKETLREVMEFARLSAHHPNVELDRLLLLHIGGADRQGEFMALYNDA